MTTAVRAPCDEALILSCHAQRAPVSEIHGGWVLAAAILGSSMAFIDGSVVNVALPAVQSAMNATLAEVQWVVVAFTLTLAAFLLTGGSLGDLYGRRRIFLVGVILFTAASVWCGLSPTIAQLVIARGVQGIGGALLVPESLALISASFTGEARGRAIGTWSGFTSITAAFGPVLGGWLVEHSSWRWAFLINIPLAVVVVAITLRYVPESHGAGSASVGGGKPHIDYAGVLLTTVGLGMITYGLIQSAVVVGVIGCGLVVVFVVVESRARAPMLPLSLFRSSSFSGANLLTLFLYTALGAIFFFFPLNLIQVQKYNAAEAGAALLPFIGLMFVLSRWAGGLIRQYGSKGPLIVGPIIQLLALGVGCRR